MVLDYNGHQLGELSADKGRVMHKHFTVDRVEIVDGLRAWDYDNDRVTVCFEHTSGMDERYSPFDGWFTVHPVGEPHTRWGKIMNGERLVTVNPFTREKA